MNGGLRKGSKWFAIQIAGACVTFPVWYVLWHVADHFYL